MFSIFSKTPKVPSLTVAVYFYVLLRVLEALTEQVVCLKHPYSGVLSC